MENKQLLKINGSESEEDVKEFELPPARARRPKLRRAAAENKISQGSFCTCRGCLSLVLLTILLASFLLLGWYIVIMQQDINMLKEHLHQVEDDDVSNLQSSTKLQQDLNGKLSALANDEKEINELREKLKIANAKIDQLNQTVLSLQLHMTKAGSVATLSSDVDRLKKGMADTGVEIQKLTDEQDDMKKKNDRLVTIVKTMNNKMFNITAKLLSKDVVAPPPPQFPPITSWKKSPELKNLAHKMITLSKNLQGEQAKWKADLKNNSNFMKMEMYKLYSYLDVINETCQVAHSSDRQSMKTLQNSTKMLQGKLHLLELKFMPLVGALHKQNSSSNANGAVIEGRISTLTDVVDQQRIKVDNVTERLSYLEKLAKDSLASEGSPGTNTMPTSQKGSNEAVISTKHTPEAIIVASQPNSEAIIATSQPNSEAIIATSQPNSEVIAAVASQATPDIVTEVPTSSSVLVTEEESFEALTTSTTKKNTTVQTTPLPNVKKELLPIENTTLSVSSRTISSNSTSSKYEISPTLSASTAKVTITSEAGHSVKTTEVPITHQRTHRTIDSPTKGNQFDVLDENNDNVPRDFNWNNEGDDDDVDVDNLDDM